MALGVAPHLSSLTHSVPTSHQHWYDAYGHLYLAWERAQTLVGGRGFFDFRFFWPYASTGTYNEPSLTQGALFGVFSAMGAPTPLAFNLMCLAVLVANGLALNALLWLAVRRRALAAVFATVGALSPFIWARAIYPPTTLVFWGLLGALYVARSARRPSLIVGAAGPVCFALQAYSSLYAAMAFAVPATIYGPVIVARAWRRGTLRRAIAGWLIGLAIAGPPLVWLHGAYAETRRALHTGGTRASVAKHMPMATSDLLPRTELACQLRWAGVERSGEACRETLFPGRLAVVGALVALGLVGLGLRRRRRLGRVAVAIAAGAILTVVLGQTWPGHVGLWAALIAARHPRAARAGPPLAAALLIMDVATNPVVSLAGFELESAHRWFFAVVPGFDGLRSEYRVAVLLAPCLAALGAIASRWSGRLDRGLPLAGLVLWALFDARPMWQAFRPVVHGGNAGAALRAAATLPDEAVLAVIRMRGRTPSRPGDVDQNRWLTYVTVHRHRQITAYATYQSPGSRAVRRAAQLEPIESRWCWIARTARLLGATHLLLDWHGEPASSPESLVRQFAARSCRLRPVIVDDRRALVAIDDAPNTAHGPVPDVPPAPSALLFGEIRTSPRTGAVHRIADGDPSTIWRLPRRQRNGDAVQLLWTSPHEIAGLAFSVGPEITSIPTGYAIEVRSGGGWARVAEQRVWAVPESLIRAPWDGWITARFDPTPARAVRLVVTQPSPWPLAISRIAAIAAPLTVDPP